ncbi:MAG: YggS family pyridoxal phosphate-dependent enzyme [Cytophagales bacterium]
MSIAQNISKIKAELAPFNTKLIAVTKMRSLDLLAELYDTGHKIFGENKVQELVPKYEALQKDIEWHLIGHLQTNKVKYIAPFVHTIHSVDSLKLLEEINKQAAKNQRVINCLLQMYIAKEETKFGLDEAEALGILNEIQAFENIKIIGLMGMATNSIDVEVVRNEFRSLRAFFDKIKSISSHNIEITELSMGMSGDYLVAAQEGSTMVRIGSAVFS